MADPRPRPADLAGCRSDVAGSRADRPAVRAWLGQSRAFASRYLRQHTRSPAGLAFLVAWPAFWYLLVAHLLFAGAGPDATSVATAKAAFAVSFGLFGAFTVSLTGVVGSFTADVETKRYRKLRSLPVSPAADLVGRFVAGTALSAVSYLGLLVIGLVDGAAFALRGPISPFVVLVGLVAYTAVGVATAVSLAAMVPRPEYATTLATALLLATFFGTGFNGVSPGLFPGPPALLNVIPVSLVTRVQLAHLVAPATETGGFGPPPLPIGPGEFAMVIAFGLGALALGSAVVERAVYEGELGE